MGFNSGFKGLNGILMRLLVYDSFYPLILQWAILRALR